MRSLNIMKDGAVVFVGGLDDEREGRRSFAYGSRVDSFNVDANYDGKIDDADEPLEENPGGIACVGTNNVTPINLKVAPAGLPGKVTLSATEGGNRIRLWQNANRTGEITLPVEWKNGAPIPETLFVEGITNSAAARDVELKLEYDENPVCQSNPLFKCEDKIKLTVIKVEIEVNNTEAQDDDIVCRYSKEPAGRPILPCQIRLIPSCIGNQTVVLTSSKVRFPNVGDVTKHLTLSGNGTWTSFNISGQVESAILNDATIEAHLGSISGVVCGTEDLTVLWASNISLRNTQDADFSIDNECAVKPFPSKLGNQKITGPYLLLKPALSHVVELCALVNPTNFSQKVMLARDCLQEFIGIENPNGLFNRRTNSYARILGGNDTGDLLFQDNIAQFCGHIYAWDMPGFALHSGATPSQEFVDHTKLYVRYNFVQYAIFNGERCSDDTSWYARVTGEIVGLDWSHYTRQGHPDDNASGLGATTMDEN